MRLTMPIAKNNKWRFHAFESDGTIILQIVVLGLVFDFAFHPSHRDYLVARLTKAANDIREP